MFTEVYIITKVLLITGVSSLLERQEYAVSDTLQN